MFIVMTTVVVVDEELEDACMKLLLQQCGYGSANAAVVVSSYLQSSSFSSLHVSNKSYFTNIYPSLARSFSVLLLLKVAYFTEFSFLVGLQVCSSCLREGFSFFGWV